MKSCEVSLGHTTLSRKKERVDSRPLWVGHAFAARGKSPRPHDFIPDDLMLDPSGQYHAFAERGAGRDPSGCHAFAERGTGLAYDEDMKKGVERNEYTHTTHPPSPAVSSWAYGQIPLCLPMRHTASTLVATCVKHTWTHAPAHTSTRCVRARARGSRHPSHAGKEMLAAAMTLY